MSTAENANDRKTGAAANVEPAKESKKKPAPAIHVNLAFCKGCDICVVACPKNCLALELSKVVVVNAEACNGCMLCELRCPDFAIWIGDPA